MGTTRLQALPDVPTVAESGYPGAQASSWWGIFAPAGTPKPIIERFRTALVESLREERVAKQLTETQQMTLVLSGPEQLRSFASEQARIWAPSCARTISGPMNSHGRALARPEPPRVASRPLRSTRR